MLNLFRNLSIRWKFQIGFFAVTMVTTLYNRWLATNALEESVEIARQGNAPEAVVNSLEAARESFIVHAIWESGIEFIIQFVVIFFVASLFVRPIKNLINALQEAGAGNLQKKVEVVSKDEIGELGNHFNQMTGNLRCILNRLDISSRSMGQSAFQIATMSHDITCNGDREQQGSNEVRNMTDQLVQVSKIVQKQAESTSNQAKDMSRHAMQGVDMVEQNLAVMNEAVEGVRSAAGEVQELSVTATQISTITSTITQIAEQTNLLALNAAIEAARAGDHGRGFAVVADEVRMLASNTAKSSAEIADIAGTLHDGVNKAIAAMENVAGQVQKSGDSARQTSTMIAQMGKQVANVVNDGETIVMQSTEQINALADLQHTLERLFQTLKVNASKTSVTADIGNGLYDLAGELESIISGFDFRETRRYQKADAGKREYPRIESKQIVLVKQDGREWEGLTNDISMSGVKIQLSSPLADNTGKVELSMYLPSETMSNFEHQELLRVAASIQWYREDQGKYLYGLAFVDITEDEKRRVGEIFSYYLTESIYS